MLRVPGTASPAGVSGCRSETVTPLSDCSAAARGCGGQLKSESPFVTVNDLNMGIYAKMYVRCSTRRASSVPLLPLIHEGTSLTLLSGPRSKTSSIDLAQINYRNHAWSSMCTHERKDTAR